MPVTLRDETSPLNNRSGSDRDFVLYYTTARERVGVNLVTHRTGDEDGYFMLLAAPDAAIAPQEIAAKDVVFVFDTSGSMAGEKIEQARKALLNLLGNLNPNDRFNIVTFSSDVRTFRDSLTPVSTHNVDAARTFTNEIKAVGGTNINDAAGRSLKMSRGERPHRLVFMTDGSHSRRNRYSQILKNVRARNLSAGTATQSECA
jgi:Ca-activated chloride channel family protein